MQHDDRPPHLISPDEVSDWLAGSSVIGTTFHRTSREAADRIRRLGAARHVLTYVALFPVAFILAMQADLAQRAAWALPANLLTAIAIALLPLLAIYWVVAKVFGQLEFTDKAVTPA